MKLLINETSTTSAIVAFPMENLDASNVKEFREAMLVVTGRFEVVLIDMNALNFVDSSGLGALLSCLRAMNGKNGQLRLFGMTKPVKALFELVRMHRIFPIFNSQEEALTEVALA